MTSRTRLTDRRIAEFVCPAGKSQAFLWDTTVPTLALRVSAKGRKSFVFEARLNRDTLRIPIGTIQVWSLDEARKKATGFKKLLDEKIDPRVEIRRRVEQYHQGKVAQEVAHTLTLRALLDDYVEHLKSTGRSSWKDVQSIFSNHVYQPFAKWSERPANQVTGEEITDCMRAVHDKGHGRTANKLRSYIRAAFGLAKSARLKASIPAGFKRFDIRVNPAEDTLPNQEANQPDKNPLSEAELKLYWRNLKENQDQLGARVLQLHLLTGGQRVAQFIKLRASDVHEDRIVLWDGKGRSGQAARAHHIPLLPEARALLDSLNTGGAYAISSNGATHVAPMTMTNWAHDFGKGIPDFQLKRVRSGVETLLASRGVSRDTRGRLQSHGISGVQDRHYDGHDYLPEKKRALQILLLVLEDSEPQALTPPLTLSGVPFQLGIQNRSLPDQPFLGAC